MRQQTCRNRFRSLSGDRDITITATEAAQQGRK